MDKESLGNLKRNIGYDLSNPEKCKLALWIMSDVQDSLDFEEEKYSGTVDLKEIPVIPF